MPINVEIQELVEKRSKYINKDLVNFGENNKLAKDSCEILEDILKRVKLLSNDPAFYVDEYFSDLKKRIDLTREEYIQLIEKNYIEILDKVIESEKECKIKGERKKHDLTKMIQNIENKLSNLNESLKLPDFTKDNEWKRIRFDVAKDIQNIEDEIENYKCELLLYKDFDFIPIEINQNNNFGNFHVRNVEIGKVNMVLNNFSYLKPENSESLNFIESRESCFVKDIPWIIRTRLEKKSDEDYLAFYIAPKCDNKRINNIPISAKLIQKIHQIETRKTTICNEIAFSSKFEKIVGVGLRNFISKKEIINPLNGFYNKENDSIFLQAIVKILS